jgi:hypothetical protein
MNTIRTFRVERTGVEQLVQWIGFVGVIMVFGLLYVWQQIQTRDLKRDIMQLESRKTLLIQENSRYHEQVARLSSQNAVETVVMDVLQMDYPMVGQIINVSEEALAVVPPYATKPDTETEPQSLAVSRIPLDMR